METKILKIIIMWDILWAIVKFSINLIILLVIEAKTLGISSYTAD